MTDQGLAGWRYVRRIAGRCTPAVLALGVLSTAAQAPAKPGQTSAQNAPEQDPPKVITERQKTLAEEADRLLVMAQSLKATVDATRKDELSVEVVREADRIERLAKAVKDRMRQ